MKKIMILGASILQVPAIKKAKDMGLYVIAVDMDEDAIGFKYADKSLVISTLDKEAVLAVAKKEKINGIMTIASDRPMMTVAKVAEEMNLPGIDCQTALNATNKTIMRRCLYEAKVPVPLFYMASTKDEYLNGIKKFRNKCILKPADNSGSRGIFLIENTQNKELINNAYDYTYQYSNSGDILLEEFMEGPEVSVETLSVEGICNVIAITDKLTTGAPNFVEMGHSQPSMLSKDICKKIEKITIDAVKAIGIKTGPAHTEIIVTEDGPKIVEIGARLGGDNITTHLVPLSTGVDMVKCTIQLALGENINFGKKLEMGSAIRYFKTPKGKIKNISGVREADSIPELKQISFVKNVGDIASDINSSSDRIGFMIAQCNHAFEAINVCEQAISLVKFEIE